MKEAYLLLIIFCSLYVSSCINAPDLPDEPTLEFVSLSKLMMMQAPLNGDTTILTLDFTDGDGDIGFGMSTTGSNIFVIDNRTGEFFDRFRIPAIPEQGANNGITGTINMVLLNTCCVFPPQDSIPACESPKSVATRPLCQSCPIHFRRESGPSRRHRSLEGHEACSRTPAWSVAAPAHVLV